MLKTPLKSPSLINNRVSALTPNKENQQIGENQDESLDYSFEFREQFQKNSRNKSSKNFDDLATFELGSNKVTSNLGSDVNKQTSLSKPITRKNSEKSLTDSVSSDLGKSSPQVSRKNSQNKQTRDTKRFKQLTMTQAFATQNETNCAKSKSSDTACTSKQASASNKITLNEPNKSRISQYQIKDEPILIVIYGFFIE